MDAIMHDSENCVRVVIFICREFFIMSECDHG